MRVIFAYYTNFLDSVQPNSYRLCIYILLYEEYNNHVSDKTFELRRKLSSEVFATYTAHAVYTLRLNY